jgi:WD40 repeat protein
MLELLHPTAPAPDHSRVRHTLERVRALAVAGERAFTIEAGGRLVARSLPDARVLWECPCRGHLLAAGGGGFVLVVERARITLREPGTGRVIEDRPLPGVPRCVAVSERGSVVVSTLAGDVFGWHEGDWQPLELPPGKITALALGPGGLLLMAREDGAVELLDAHTGEARRSLRGAASAIRALACGDGLVLAAGEERLVHRWELSTGRALPPLAGHQRPVLGLGLDAEGRLWTVGKDQRLCAWNPRASVAAPALSGHGGGVRACCLQGERAFTGGRDGLVRSWDLGIGGPLELWLRGGSAITCMLGLSSGGLVVGRSDGSMLCLHAPEQRRWGQRRAHEGPLTCLARSDGLVFSGGADGVMRAWDLASGLPVSAQPHHAVRLRCLALSPDGELLASGGYDGSLVVASPLGGGSPAHSQGHEGPVVGCAWVDDAVVTAGMDGTLRRWTARGEPRGTVQAHQGGAVGVAALGAERFVSVGGDGRLCLWSLPSREGAPSLLAALDLGLPLDGLGVELTAGGQGRALVGDRYGGAHAVGVAL